MMLFFWTSHIGLNYLHFVNSNKEQLDFVSGKVCRVDYLCNICR